MLYTTYFSNMKNIPEDAIKLIVTRYTPRDFNILQYPKTHIVSELAPTAQLLNSYNNTNKTHEDWVNFKTNFINEIGQREELKYNINKIIKALNKGLDVCLVCYERNYFMCHRYLLAQHIISLCDCEYKEL